jgi:hypothetical protein
MLTAPQTGTYILALPNPCGLPVGETFRRGLAFGSVGGRVSATMTVLPLQCMQ